MSTRIVTATAAHARVIAASMRERDIAEVRAGWMCEPMEAMQDALEASFYARTLLYDLEPLCIYGLAPLTVLSGAARIWIFASSAIDRHGFAFARGSRRFLPEMFRYCQLATNLIDMDDAPALRWMQWLGGRCVLPGNRHNGRLFAQFVLTEGEARCQQA